MDQQCLYVIQGYSRMIQHEMYRDVENGYYYNHYYSKILIIYKDSILAIANEMNGVLSHDSAR